jgi:hypothetical protein
MKYKSKDTIKTLIKLHIVLLKFLYIRNFIPNSITIPDIAIYIKAEVAKLKYYYIFEKNKK